MSDWYSSLSFKRISQWLLLALLTCGLLYFFLGDHWQRWLRDRAIHSFLRKIQPSLPFTIEHVQLDTSWLQLLRGKPAQLELQIRRGDFQAKMKGKLFLEMNGLARDVGVIYQTQTELIWSLQAAEPLNLEILVTLDRDFKNLSRLGFKIPQQNWKWPVFQLESDGLKMDLKWEKQALKTEFSWQALTWENQTQSQALSLSQLSVELESALEIKTLELGPELKLKWQAEAGEFLNGDDYYQFPLSKIPGESHAKGIWNLKQSMPQWQDWQLTLGSKIGAGPTGQITAKLMRQSEGRWHWQFIAEQLALPFWLNELPKIFSWTSAPDWQVTQGKLTIHAESVWVFQGLQDLITPLLKINSSSLLSALVDTFQARIHLHRFTGLWPSAQLRWRNAQLSIPLSWIGKKSAASGSITVDELQYKNFIVAIPKRPLSAVLSSLASPEHEGWQLTLNASEGIELGFPKILQRNSKPYALALGPTQLSMGKHWVLQSALNIPSVPLRELAYGLCWDPQSLPPGELEGEFSRLAYEDQQFQAVGGILGRLFGGTFQVSKFEFSRLFSPESEIKLQANWGGVQLNQIGKWIRFGEIDGLLEGYLRQLIIRQGFPVQYDFLSRIVPHRRGDVVFSPDAMKNFVRLVSGEKIDEKMPGFVRWFVFGWPRRVFGGYDVDYVGLKLRSRQGVIVLETLDPPNEFERSGQHFLLKGSGLSGFNMPIKSKTYPVLLDAPAMSHFVRHLWGIISGLKNSDESQSKEKNDATVIPCFQVQ